MIYGKFKYVFSLELADTYVESFSPSIFRYLQRLLLLESCSAGQANDLSVNRRPYFLSVIDVL